MAVRVKTREWLRVRISSGFWILLAFLFWLDKGIGILLPALAAAVLHELGHLTMISLVGGGVKEISLTAVGAEIQLDEAVPLSYWKDALAALAGPLASLLCAWAALGVNAYLLAAMCVGQGIFNLMPIELLDGGRILYALIAGMADDRWAQRVLSVTSALVVGALLGVGLILLRQYGNPTLAITAGWLLLGIFRRKE